MQHLYAQYYYYFLRFVCDFVITLLRCIHNVIWQITVLYYCLCFCCSGVHHKGKNCDPAVKVQQIESLLQSGSANLFPQQLYVAGNIGAPKRLPKQNGGWGDIRDHELCLSFVNGPKT